MLQPDQIMNLNRDNFAASVVFSYVEPGQLLHLIFSQQSWIVRELWPLQSER